jgi:phosphate transport system substrate-binding protein
MKPASAGKSLTPRRAQRRGAAFFALLLGLTVVLTACGGAATATSPSGAATAPTKAATTAAAASTSATTTSSSAASPSSSSATSATSASTTRAASPTTSGTAAAGATPNASSKIAGAYQGEADTLNGAGSTFVQVLFSKWFDDYAKLTNVKVNYQGVGSGAGKKAITDQTVDFAASDAFMTDAELQAAEAKCGATILHFPIALGAVVVTYNIPGLEQTKLKMDGDVIAGIFMGEITKWNDAKIAAANPGVNLPNEDIVVVHRADGSGTTDIFTSYLTAASSKWAGQIKSGTTVNWPVGIGANGNAGVAGELKNSPYSIGYVELAYANQNKLPVADVKNKAGKFITPSNAGVTAAANAFAPTAPADLRLKIVNADGDAAYPIAGMTWVLVCPKQTDQAKAIALTRLLWWGLHEGQAYNEGLDYAKVPDTFIVKEEQFINQITVNGQKAFPGK